MRIGYIGGPQHLPSARNRKGAFQDAAVRLGVGGSPTLDSDFSVKGGYAAANQMLREHQPTAIVCGNDLTAIGVLHCAYDRGVRVPGQLSITGFDDIMLAEYTQPALTTVAVPRSQIGEMAFDALWDMISQPEREGTETRITPELVVRGSASAVTR
jgi:LacI family transcriptional regulator